VQREYLPLLAEWFIEEHPRQMETLRKRLDALNSAEGGVSP
jgi:hypothetical protein